MKKLFSGGGEAGSWPLPKIVGALKGKYGSVEPLGEEGPLRVFGVQDNGINFVVALMQSAPGSNKVVELGFLARFVGFPVSAHIIETINRNLHISVAALEGSELFLMAGMQVTGGYDEGQFTMVLEAWRRDLMVTLHGLDGDSASMSNAYPVAKMAEARAFAANHAPSSENPVDMLSSFLGAKASQEICEDCGGRGKRGFIARMCGACDGSGFVNRH